MLDARARATDIQFTAPTTELTQRPELLAEVKDMVRAEFNELAPYLPPRPICEEVDTRRTVSVLTYLPVARIITTHFDYPEGYQPSTEGVQITPSLVIETVAEVTGMDAARIVEPGRQDDVVLVRQLASFLIREHIDGISDDKIGREFGGQDHTTVRYSRGKVEQKLADGDPETTRLVRVVNEALQAPSGIPPLEKREIVDWIVLTSDDLYVCPQFEPSPQDQMITGNVGTGVMWSERATDDQLWQLYLEPTIERLHAAAQRIAQQ